MHAFRCSLVVLAALVACHSQHAVTPAPVAPVAAAEPPVHQAQAPVRQDPPIVLPRVGFAEHIQTGRCAPDAPPKGPLRLDEVVLTGPQRCVPSALAVGSMRVARTQRGAATIMPAR